MVFLRVLSKIKYAGLCAAFAAMPSGHALSEGAVSGGDATEPYATLSAEELEAARGLFVSWSCGGCHVLAHAKSMGPLGPSLDGNPKLTYAFVKNRIEYGQGAMPPFGGDLTDEEIAALAAYVMQVREK